MNRILALVPLAALLALGLLFAVWSLKRDPNIHPDALVGHPTPKVLVGRLDGQADLSLDKAVAQTARGPVLLNVFASWCAPCRVETPELLRLRAEGVTIIGLAWKDDPQATRTMLKDLGDPYALVLSDRSGRAGVDLGITGVPETYLIDGRGVIAAKLSKPLTRGEAERLRLRLVSLR